jgi:hypothetical protein
MATKIISFVAQRSEANEVLPGRKEELAYIAAVASRVTVQQLEHSLVFVTIQNWLNIRIARRAAEPCLHVVRYRGCTPSRPAGRLSLAQDEVLGQFPNSSTVPAGTARVGAHT